MMVDQQAVELLAGSLHSLGVTLPEALGDLLDALDVVEETRVPDPAAALARRVMAGDVDVAGLGDELEQAIEVTARAGAAHDARALITDALCRRFSTLLAGTEGDALLDAVRPQYEAARAAMHTSEFGPGTDAAQVIAAGDDAVREWRALPAAEATLTTLWDGLIRPLVSTFGVLPASTHVPFTHLPALLITADPTQARRVANEVTGLISAAGPGGRWHGVGLGPLNTLAEARKVLADMESRGDTE